MIKLCCVWEACATKSMTVRTIVGRSGGKIVVLNCVCECMGTTAQPYSTERSIFSPRSVQTTVAASTFGLAHFQTQNSSAPHRANELPRFPPRVDWPFRLAQLLKLQVSSGAQMTTIGHAPPTNLVATAIICYGFFNNPVVITAFKPRRPNKREETKQLNHTITHLVMTAHTTTNKPTAHHHHDIPIH